MIRIFGSDENSEVNEFLKDIENTYNKYFPNSTCWARVYDARPVVYGLKQNSICINCYLAGDNRENSGGYWENDIFNITFWLHDVVEGDGLIDNMELTSTTHSYRIKPTNKYLAFESKRVPFRVVKGNSQKILQGFDRFCKKLRDMVEEDYYNDNFKSDKGYDHLNFVGKKLGL